MATSSSVFSRLRRSAWLHPFNDRAALDRLLQQVNPLWSTGQVRARVLALQAEADDAVSLLLQPNRHWRGHRAGQHVLLDIEIDGCRHQRAFSLSSAAQPRAPLRLTIKRSPRAQASAAVAALKPGQVVSLSQAQGRFVLPDPLPAKLLLIGAGSGITPLLAMLEQLAAQGYPGDLLLLQACRQRQQRLLGAPIDAALAALPQARLQLHASDELGRLDAPSLLQAVPDLAEREVFVCGPEGLMEVVQATCDRLGNGGRVRRERFGGARLRAADQLGQTPRAVHCRETEQSFTADPQTSLLEAAEAAGLRPAHGCRAGICRSCLCEKRAGATRNLLTGVQSDSPGEWIQLCIHSAQSDLELAL